MVLTVAVVGKLDDSSCLLFFFFSAFLFSSVLGLLSLPLFLQKKIRPSLSFGLPIYRKKTWSRYAFRACLQSRNGWSAIGASLVAVGARRERRGRIFEIFRFCSVKNGGKEEDEQCRSKRHRSDLPLFFLYIYIYETASFWVKRVVSFKWLNFKSVPQIRSPPLLLAAFFTLVLGL